MLEQFCDVTKGAISLNTHQQGVDSTPLDSRHQKGRLDKL